ncbi:MAG: hypothetical protein EA403_06335 [Spirochaetaceae bacterium]|nr:MAG: hypothetical protein EA403_06335 [Spirochaetaceae bacterium]
MTHKELLTNLVAEGVEFVVIGGTALRLYNSPRVTHDIDLAIRALDVDHVVDVMYRLGYCLVTSVTETHAAVCSSAAAARAWIERESPGSASFVMVAGEVASEVPLDHIDVASQVDFLFELTIPAMHLRKNARRIELPDLSFLVASVDDLIRLKEARSDRSAADEDDLRFLRALKGE